MVLAGMPEFKVGYLGRGCLGSSKHPWTNYSIGIGPMYNWGEAFIEAVWEDLSQGKKGIIFSVWDASRLLWFTQPNDGLDEKLQKFLRSGKFERWGYFMLDAMGLRGGLLPLEQSYVLASYPRVCVASEWGCIMAERSLDKHPDLDWLPHGIDRSIFKPMDEEYRQAYRTALGVRDGAKLVGCVMANQGRKHWPVVLSAFVLMRENLRQKGGDAQMWIHTDTTLKDWDIQSLIVETGLGEAIMDPALSDRELAYHYAACDSTVLISGGEGFCYPVAESLSCGTPVVTGTYGAQAELVHGMDSLVEPVAHHCETSHNVMRAIYNPADVAGVLERVLEEGERIGRRVVVETCVKQVEHLDWEIQRGQWEKWFRRGLVRRGLGDAY